MEHDCRLHGFWGGSGAGKLHTMTEQGVMLGITSFQLEIPRAIRRKLAQSPAYINGLAKIIVDLYNDFIVPRWMCKEISVKNPNIEYAQQVVEENVNFAKVIPEYLRWDDASQERMI